MWKERIVGEHALRGAQFLERTPRLGRQQFSDDLGHGGRVQRFVRQAHVTALGDDVRRVAHVQHERFPVHADDGLEEGRNESHKWRAFWRP